MLSGGGINLTMLAWRTCEYHPNKLIQHHTCPRARRRSRPSALPVTRPHPNNTKNTWNFTERLPRVLDSKLSQQNSIPDLRKTVYHSCRRWQRAYALSRHMCRWLAHLHDTRAVADALRWRGVSLPWVRHAVTYQNVPPRVLITCRYSWRVFRRLLSVVGKYWMARGDLFLCSVGYFDLAAPSACLVCVWAAMQVSSHRRKFREGVYNFTMPGDTLLLFTSLRM